MQFFKDQITQSFNKEDSSMESIKDGDDNIIVGQGQEHEEEEDINSEDMDIQERQIVDF